MNQKPKIHRECYGQLFPDFERIRYNRAAEGKAFTVFVEQIGMGTQRRELAVKQDNWDKCTICADFQPCYALSMAKLALHRALAMC